MLQQRADNHNVPPYATLPVKRYGVPHPYLLPSLWRSSHQEFSWADSQPYGIPISVEFL